MKTAMLGLLLGPVVALGLTAAAQAASVSVAVAANFTDAAKAIGKAYTAATGNEVSFSFGATGQLYTQISQSAPFEILLSADSSTPKKAVKAGFGVKGSEFTYAVGKLVLFSADPKLVTGADTLKTGSFDKLSIADPKAAPYGAAAIETMKKLGVYDTLQPKIVTGSSIAQAYQFVDSRNADLGFVALSQVIKRSDGSRWVVDQADYAPIAQDAVLLTPGKDDKAARGFLAFLKGPQAVAVIKSFGYAVGK